MNVLLFAVVGAKTFELLFNCYQSNLDECSSVFCGINRGHVLKVSATIRTSNGIGRLVLTTKRLVLKVSATIRTSNGIGRLVLSTKMLVL